MPFDKAQLYDFYNSNLRHALLANERLRIKSRNIFLGIATVLIVLNFVLAYMFLRNSNQESVFLLLMLVAFTGFQVWGVYWFSSRTFRNAFKQQVIKKLVQFVSQDLRYAPQSYVPQSMFTASRLFRANFNRYRGEDRIYGQLDGLNFEFSELNVQKRSGSGSKKRTVTIFQGLFFALELPEPTRTTTLVYPRLASQPRFFSQYKRARLEDPAFERKFNVYTTDQVGARMQLTPDVMEKMMQLRALSKQTPYLSFDYKHLYIAVPSQHNHLEASLFKSVLNPSTVRNFLDELDMLLSIPRVLQLEDTRVNTPT